MALIVSNNAKAFSSKIEKIKREMRTACLRFNQIRPVPYKTKDTNVAKPIITVIFVGGTKKTSRTRLSNIIHIKGIDRRNSVETLMCIYYNDKL